MIAIKRLQRRYGGGALTTAAVLGGAVYLAGYPAVARGLVLGTLFSAVNFLLLGNAVGRNLTERPRGRVGPLFNRWGRYLLWAVPVILAVKWPSVDLPATIAGVFMVPLLIVLDSVHTLTRGR